MGRHGRLSGRFASHLRADARLKQSFKIRTARLATRPSLTGSSPTPKTNRRRPFKHLCGHVGRRKLALYCLETRSRKHPPPQAIRRWSPDVRAVRSSATNSRSKLLDSDIDPDLFGPPLEEFNGQEPSPGW